MSNIFEDEKLNKFLSKHGDQLKGMAKNIGPETLKNEQELKRTLKMLANMANLPADDKKINQVVKMLQQQKFDPKDPNSMNKVISNIKKNKP